MNHHALRLSAVAAAASVALWSGASFAQQISLKLASAVAGGPVQELGASAFAEKIVGLTAGRIKVQVFPGGGLGNALKVPETVKNGVAELGYSWMAYDWGIDKTTVLFAGYAGSFELREDAALDL